MKNVSAKATFSDKAKSLFSAKETSREIANRVLEQRPDHLLDAIVFSSPEARTSLPRLASSLSVVTQ